MNRKVVGYAGRSVAPVIVGILALLLLSGGCGVEDADSASNDSTGVRASSVQTEQKPIERTDATCGQYPFLANTIDNCPDYTAQQRQAVCNYYDDTYCPAYCYAYLQCGWLGTSVAGTCYNQTLVWCWCDCGT